MNKNLQCLLAIAQKKQRHIVGLMSGTSLDGLDIALCQIEGEGLNSNIVTKAFETAAYSNDFKHEVKSVFSKKQIELEKLCLLNSWVAKEQAKLVNRFLAKNNLTKEGIDLLASHGQTIYHAPLALHKQEKFGNATLQIGDGDHLAVNTGIITVSDFRQKHIASGGEGAPLAFYGDYLLFSTKTEDRIMLNIGGIANFTYLPASVHTEKIFSTDTGPGNTMMDALIQQHDSEKHFDEDAAIASKGIVNESLLMALKNHPFFKSEFPKTTGPELFNLAYLEIAKQKAEIDHINLADTIATLNLFSAITIVEAIQKTMQKKNNFSVYVSGGGVHNPLLMNHIKNLLPSVSIKLTSELGFNPDAKEAVLFAILANECVAGGNTIFEKNAKNAPAVTMGKISFPW